MSCDPGSGCGVVLKLMSNSDGSWTESVLYTFCSMTNCSDGKWPGGGLVFDQKGNLYGTTWQGGANVHGAGAFGTLFKLTPSSDGRWAETVLYNFCSLNSCQDGLAPFGGVIFGQGGNLYGTTLDGGSAGCGAGCGVVFKLTPNLKGGWKETVRHYFLDRPGAEPYAGLMLDASGTSMGRPSGTAQRPSVRCLKSRRSWLLRLLGDGVPSGRRPDYKLITVETVRRERRWTSAGATPALGTGSLHPVAIEAAAEATKLSELSMERVAGATRRA